VKLNLKAAVSVATLAAILVAPAALADTAEADCVLRKDGENKEGASGPCSFSQRQGYVDIDLRNGATFSLSPGNEPDHYRDQEGKKVVRTIAGDGSHEYKWEGKKIIVRFRAEASHDKSAAQGSGHPGDTPHDLKDLPGSQYVGGEVDDEMVRRGYRHVRDEETGGQIRSYWHSNHGGHCVVVHMGEKRHVKSVANAAKSDCG
jgi:hypothetical protein